MFTIKVENEFKFLKSFVPTPTWTDSPEAAVYFANPIIAESVAGFLGNQTDLTLDVIPKEDVYQGRVKRLPKEVRKR
jgi:hypothetical protein